MKQSPASASDWHRNRGTFKDGALRPLQTLVQLDHMTQQNAALVEESSAVAASLEDQAQARSRTVTVFRLESDACPSDQGSDAVDMSMPLDRLTLVP
ncbi:MAG TPA: hypothetical protein VFY22_11515 [Hydrogenophaga sp.]|nr:hypothetical protein [Hydrogenophaga sp.]